MFGVWKWLDGKKTKLGVIALVVAQGLEKANVIPAGTVATVANLGSILLTALGLIHKMDKHTDAVKTLAAAMLNKSTDGGGSGG